jgi:FkbM family methyltransferase
MLTAAKAAGKRLFGAFGLEIRKARPPVPPRASMTGALRQLASLGFRPRTVIDVGVACETAELYEAFPESAILLIEPLAEFEPFLRKICNSRKAQYILAAAGQKAGTATLNVHAGLGGSSLFKEVEGEFVEGVPRQVPVVTVDDMCEGRGLPGPYVIKVDVQGAELQVLAGAERTLRATEAVILEMTLFGTMIGGPQVYDVISRMRDYGFVLYDLYGFTYRPLDDALAQVDGVFVREAGRFRASHAFSTPVMRREQFANDRAYFQERSGRRSASER